jgi:hypothetical protein
LSIFIKKPHHLIQRIVEIEKRLTAFLIQRKNKNIALSVAITFCPPTEDFKLEVVATVKCISNDYLKLNNEDYQDYLLDIATDKIFLVRCDRCLSYLIFLISINFFSYFF